MKVVTNCKPDDVKCLSGRHAVEFDGSEYFLDTWYDPNSYQLVLIDVDTSEGVYSPRVLREAKTTLPIIGITRELYLGEDEDWLDNQSTFIEQGGDYLLRSPINQRELLSCMSALNRRFQEIRPTMFLAENRLMLNSYSRVATFDGVPLDLTGKENLVLMDLADNFGRTCSKEQILNACYVNSVDAAELKIVDVFICKIRKKLNETHPGLGGIVETVWGQGYRLVDVKMEDAQEAS